MCDNRKWTTDNHAVIWANELFYILRQKDEVVIVSKFTGYNKGYSFAGRKQRAGISMNRTITRSVIVPKSAFSDACRLDTVGGDVSTDLQKRGFEKSEK